MSKATDSRRAIGGRRGAASPLANPRLLVPVAVVVLGAGYFVFQWWQSASAEAGRRAKLLADTATEVAKAEPDDGALSQLMAGLRKQPDHDTAADLLAAQAEIHLVRGSAERAYGVFATVAAKPGSTPADQRLGARILLRRQQGFGGERSAAAAMLEQVITFSERAYQDGADPADLFRAWQATQRLWAHDRATAIATRLQASHGGTPQAQVAQLMATFDPARHAEAVDELISAFTTLPPELSALSTLVVLQSGDVPQALRQADAELNLAPGVPAVRYVAAIVYHACALGSEVGSVDRDGWVRRRDAQLDWLAASAPAEEPLQAKWAEMRAVR